jgi:hypothetical protein
VVVRRRAAPIAVPDDVVAGLVREIVVVHYPDELDLLADVVAQARRPRRALMSRRLRAPVGMGVDLAAVSPVLVSVLSFVGMAVANRVTDEALTSLSEAAYRRLARVFRRDAGGTAVVAAIDETEVHWAQITAMVVVLLIRHGMGPAAAAEVAAQIVTVLRRHDPPPR